MTSLKQKVKVLMNQGHTEIDAMWIVIDEAQMFMENMDSALTKFVAKADKETLNEIYGAPDERS